MKNFKQLFYSVSLIRTKPALLAGLAALAVLVVAGSVGLPRAQASENQHQRRDDDAAFLWNLHAEAQLAELDQLLADFHGALSYGGNINAMMSLWAENSSLTFNGTPHVGKDAVQAFFTSSGYFLNNWVSLAPEFKTQITLHGDTAVCTTQCVATDLSVTPYVVRGIVQVNATAVKRHDGKWVFTSMNNTSPAPL